MQQAHAEAELCTRAQTALGGAMPAVLLRPNGTLLAANAGGRALLETAAVAAELAATLVRILPMLRADRPARLERLRLPGRLTPVVFACTLLTAGPAKAALLVAGERIGAIGEAEPAPAPQPANATPEAAAAPSLPQRFTWRTGPDARLNHIDPRLAAALDQPVETIAGRDFQALGAPGAHHAVLQGLSFNHLPIVLPTARGDALDIELGGAPIRGDGMRGFGIVRGRRAAPPTPPLYTPPPMITPAEPAPPAPPPIAATPFAAPTPPVAQPPIAGPVPPAAPVAPATEAPHGLPGQDTPAPAAPPVVPPTPPKAPNVVQLHAEPPAPRPATIRASWEGLSTGERNAFREIARALGARLEGDDDAPDFLGEPSTSGEDGPRPDTTAPDTSAPIDIRSASGRATPAPTHPLPAEPAPSVTAPTEPDGLRRVLADGERPVLDRLPLAMLAFRGDRMLYANRALLDWTGHQDLAALEAAGGLAGLFGSSEERRGPEAGALTLLTARGGAIPVEARLISTPWEGGTAMLYVLHRIEGIADERLRQAELALRSAENSERELRAILDTATDGVVLIDTAGTILSMNHPAEALFGFEAGEVKGEAFTLLFAPESHQAAIDYLDGLASNGVASVLNDGREVIGRVREGGLIPLFMTVGRIGEDATKFCAVLRDITQWKRAEEELTEAKQLAERANLAKSDFLAKISHEIRTPLNAIIGFSEVMMEERFGPIENQRYRDYLRDIHASGGHLISLINDLLDLSKIEAGKLELQFTSVPLNEIVQQCMGIMQPQANRERIIIRSSLASDLPQIVADARSIRQIVLNLVSNSVKFTRPGGQVILSTALTENSEVVLRVRDTGVGMSETDVSIAMEPFRQLATSGRSGSGGTGLGLPLTKALAEANRASFNIRSAVDVGTIVEITFPSTRVLAS
ncbi:ATP-binding protein [Ancylobacter pratisalsi]|uniref:histidine kinase n=1 Tax=Ancylobacter pratisalsi TaxID=1745854 RepID=A0A6P1YNV8_9HYPH|nr:ATP-binding protein [Ancylobacter pratisalsi]QIB35029.1 PAS domain S-box protein [Ancylobacter pratisalsi]